MFIKSSAGITSHAKLHTYEEGYLLPVLTQQELLFSHRHKGLLRLLQDLSGLSSEDFDRSYAVVLKNYMEFVQVLPHKTNGILGSLLNYGLAYSMAVYQKYCQWRGNKTTPLLKFAVFTAALLHDVGRVLTNQRIILTDDKGEYLEDWNPFSGSMLGKAEFFKMYPISAAYLRIEKTITPMLARQLIPEEYFLWLSNDPVLFADWLAALLGEEGIGSRELTLALALAKREDLMEILSLLDGANVDMLEPTATEFGEGFYRWLKDQIDKDKLAINTDDALIHKVPEGVFIDKALVKRYVDTMKVPANVLVVYQQLGNLLGIVKKSGQDYMHAAYFSPADSAGGNYSSFASSASRAKSHREGMVVDAHHVLMNKQIDTHSNLRSAKAMTVISQSQTPAKMVEAALRRKQ